MFASGPGALGIDADVERVLELIGIGTFAVSGALVAVRHGFDVVGVLALSLVTALGGGALRDVLLGATPPAAVTDRGYLAVPLAVGLVMMVAHRWSLLHLPVLVFDAAGLGLFCVTGTLKALDFGVGTLGSIGLGVLTASGGGVLRDVLAGEKPQMFRPDSVLYSIPAALGATAVVVVIKTDVYSAAVGAAIAGGVFVLRVLALRFDWHAPRPMPPARSD